MSRVALGRGAALLGVVAVVAVACGGGSSRPEPESAAEAVDSADPGGETVLLSGSVEVPGAGAFGDPGFHEPFLFTGVIPDSVGELSGELVVRLRDTARPSLTCGREHPLSGCVTVDWSDFEDRPGVPPGGVFDNRLTVVSDEGSVPVFLSETGELAPEPDDFSPG